MKSAEQKNSKHNSARQAVLQAEAANSRAGHENDGYLSFSHGFAPRITPITHFPPEFECWNELNKLAPSLFAAKKLRAYCNNMPVLDAKQLPPQFALRGALVLAYTAHAYWNIGDPPEGRKLPEALEKPWSTINYDHLGRSEVFLRTYALTAVI